MNEQSAIRSAVPLVLFAILAGGAAWACFGDRGLLANRTLAAELSAREVRQEERLETIAQLSMEIVRMKEDPKVQERWVRQELGYVKPGELLYLFPGDRSADFAVLKDRRIGPTKVPSSTGTP